MEDSHKILFVAEQARWKVEKGGDIFGERRRYIKFLEGMGYKLDLVSTLDAARRRLKEEKNYDLVITGLGIPSNGEMLMNEIFTFEDNRRFIGEAGQDYPVIILTGIVLRNRQDIVEAAKDSGGDAVEDISRLTGQKLLDMVQKTKSRS